MTIEQCTKAELIYIIKELTMFEDWQVKHALRTIEFQREKSKIEEAEKQGEIATEQLQKYFEILSPYSGKALSNIPLTVLEEAERHLKAYEKATAKEENLLSIQKGN